MPTGWRELLVLSSNPIPKGRPVLRLRHFNAGEFSTSFTRAQSRVPNIAAAESCTLTIWKERLAKEREKGRKRVICGSVAVEVLCRFEVAIRQMVAHEIFALVSPLHTRP